MTEQNTLSISEMQQQAKAGDALAQLGLACYYNCLLIFYIWEKEEFKALKTIISPKNINQELAVEWLKKAAEQGCAEAQYLLAFCFSRGDGVGKNNELAIEWLKKAAEQGYTDAQTFLAGSQNLGLKSKLGEAEAFQLLGTGYAESRCRYFEDKGELNDEFAFELNKKGAEKGIAKAQYRLALCYFEGKGIEQNDELALEWLKKAAEQGDAEAQYRLAHCYSSGNGVEQNDDLAFEWLKKAAEQGVAEAQYPLACCYFEGKGGVYNSYEHGMEWLTKAAVENNHAAANALLENYRSDRLEFDDFKKAAEQGNGDAHYRLAHCYFEGKGVNKGYQHGMEWLTKAAIEHNHAAANAWLENASLRIAFPYLVGKENVEQLYQFAFDWCAKEAKQGSAEAYLCLGILYLFGKGVEQNDALAFKCFGKAEETEHQNEEILCHIARFYLGICYASGKGVEKDRKKAGEYLDNNSDSFYRAASIGSVYANRPILPLLSLQIHYKSKEYGSAKKFIEESFLRDGGWSEHATAYNLKNICLDCVEQEEKLDKINQELDTKNKQLQEAQKELEDMMSMFAHKFRSPLDAIIYNTTHENQVKLYTEAAQTMRGLLNIFSIISTDAEILKDKIKQDSLGNGRLAVVFSKTLDMILLHLLSVSGAEKIQQHYMAYAKAHGQCDAEVSYKTWCEDYFELEQALQAEWEQSFALLLNQSATLEQRFAWLEQHFFKLELIGFERDDIQFKEYGVTESFLTILLNEILVNAFKYYSSTNKQPVVLEWTEREGYQVLICRNPSVRSERTIIKGSHKGQAFLSTLARKTGSAFTKPTPQDDFVVEFGILYELLISK